MEPLHEYRQRHAQQYKQRLLEQQKETMEEQIAILVESPSVFDVEESIEQVHGIFHDNASATSQLIDDLQTWLYIIRSRELQRRYMNVSGTHKEYVRELEGLQREQ